VAAPTITGDLMADNWRSGNAAEDGKERRGWLIGHFIENTDDIRATKDVEIKWGVHPAGEERSTWTTDEYRTTVIILVKGRFRLNLPGESILLDTQGDYVMWGAGTDHSWRAEEDSVVITVRWPSVP
jgi:mannose-6-phosphate isomerase-like protein (cupin superfamily)